ncbi:hypothetical protein JW824_10940 [bacterium]|nr:hypothetical protein [bacterium]
MKKIKGKRKKRKDKRFKIKDCEILLFYRCREKETILLIVMMMFSFFIHIQAQTGDDTLQVEEFSKKSPTGAVIRSALLPGLGQWYNGQKLKALVVLGGELALAGNAIYYNQMAVQSVTYDEGEFYRDLRGRFIWWFAGIYLLNLLDAYVDAYLWDFDTGPDLSMHRSVMGEKTIWMTFTVVY